VICVSQGHKIVNYYIENAERFFRSPLKEFLFSIFPFNLVSCPEVKDVCFVMAQVNWLFLLMAGVPYAMASKLFQLNMDVKDLTQ
jgi:hypothetical protein